MKCGREPSGQNAKQHGSCPVSTKASSNGLNGGINAGRICWILAENGCKGKVKCSNRHGEHACFQCEFRYKVIAEEGLLNICKSTGLLLENLNGSLVD
jgi:hypothetical protein